MNTTNKKVKFQAMDFKFSAKQINEALGTFEGHCATWDVDLLQDRIPRGAFAKTLQEAKADAIKRDSEFIYLVCWQHNVHEPIGGIYEAYEDSKGLYVRGMLDMDTELGRRAFSALKKKYMDSFSIGYKPRRHHMEAAKGVPGGIRVLDEIELIEVSVVSFPANPEARVTDVKTAQEAWTDSIMRDMRRTAEKLGAQKVSNRVNDFNEAAFGGRTDRSQYRESVSVPDDFEAPAAFEASLRKQRRDDDPVLGLLEPGSKAYQNEVALRKQIRDKKRAEQQAALEAERAERAERQRLMSAPTFTPAQFALATGLDESWLRVRFQGWVASGLVTAIDEKTLTLDANEVKRMAQREHGRFEARFLEIASRRERGAA